MELKEELANIQNCCIIYGMIFEYHVVCNVIIYIQSKNRNTSKQMVKKLRTSLQYTLKMKAEQMAMSEVCSVCLFSSDLKRPFTH